MIGKRLEMLRLEKKMTMKDMAQMFNLSISGWAKYENNESQPRLEVLLRIADFFNVSLDYLLCRTNIRDSNLLIKLTDVSSLVNTFQKLPIGDTSEITYLISHMETIVNLAIDGTINEKQLHHLLKLVNYISKSYILQLDKKETEMNVSSYQKLLTSLYTLFNNAFFQ